MERTSDPNLKLRALCRTSDEEVTITRMLDKVLRWSDALDKESLCIVAGQRVRSVDFLQIGVIPIHLTTF